MKRILLIFLAIYCSYGYCQSAPEMYESISKDVMEKRRDNTISRTQACETMLEAAVTFFPKDDLLTKAWLDTITYSRKKDKGEISEETYKELNKVIWDRYNDDVNQRIAQQNTNNVQDTIANYYLINAIGSAFKNNAAPVMPAPVICNTRSGMTSCY